MSSDDERQDEHSSTPRRIPHGFGISAAWSRRLATSFSVTRSQPSARYGAILKGADVCAQEPERVASGLVGRGVTATRDDLVQILKENAYAKWRDLDPEATVRFHALHLRGAGMITSPPESILARGTDWRFLRELKIELKG
jgi:NitT/TauT family transport system substrate-binding protein